MCDTEGSQNCDRVAAPRGHPPVVGPPHSIRTVWPCTWMHRYTRLPTLGMNTSSQLPCRHAHRYISQIDWWVLCHDNNICKVDGGDEEDMQATTKKNLCEWMRGRRRVKKREREGDTESKTNNSERDRAAQIDSDGKRDSKKRKLEASWSKRGGGI